MKVLKVVVLIAIAFAGLAGLTAGIQKLLHRES